MYLAIALAGAAIWVLAVVFVVAACRVAAGSGPVSRAGGDPSLLLGRSAGTARAVGSATARETGDRLTSDLLFADLISSS
jgi:hypothetical protein